MLEGGVRSALLLQKIKGYTIEQYILCRRIIFKAQGPLLVTMLNI